MKTYIMIHHSLTKDGRTFSWAPIRQYHINHNRWLDIGYHYGVELIDYEYEAMVGRPEDTTAAACRDGDMNRKAIHVLCVGNYDLQPPPEPMVVKLINYLLVPLIYRHNIAVNNIVGHRDFTHYKTCPGSKFNLEELRARVLTTLTLPKKGLSYA